LPRACLCDALLRRAHGHERNQAAVVLYASQQHAERCAATSAIVNLDVPAVRSDHVAADLQTQTCALTTLFGRVERPENVLNRAGWNAWSVVLHD